jgi:hypothetical protein
MARDFLPTLGLPERGVSACVGASSASASPALPGAPLAPRRQGTVDHGTEPLLAAAPLALAAPATEEHEGCPVSTGEAQQLSDQGEQAKTMLRKLQLAFRSQH